MQASTNEHAIRNGVLAAQHPNQSLATWTIWAGPGPDRPTWTVTASPHTPSSLLAGLSESLAHQTGTRQAQPGREHQSVRTRSAALVPGCPTRRSSQPSPRWPGR
ncbi:DUF317 domain-containing protein [Streptomyces sp. NPDC001975]